MLALWHTDHLYYIGKCDQTNFPSKNAISNLPPLEQNFSTCYTNLYVHTFFFSWISFSGFLLTDRRSPGLPVKHSIDQLIYCTKQCVFKKSLHCCFSRLLNTPSFTVAFEECHLVCAVVPLQVCVRFSHRDRRFPRLSTAPDDRGTGRAAAPLSSHNKPGFSIEEHRQSQECFHGSSFKVIWGVHSLLNVFSHVGKLFCGFQTPVCSSPLCPTGVVQQAVCPCLLEHRKEKDVMLHMVPWPQALQYLDEDVK